MKKRTPKKLIFNKLQITSFDNLSKIHGGRRGNPASGDPNCDQVDDETIDQTYQPGCANYTHYATCYCIQFGW